MARSSATPTPPTLILPFDAPQLPSRERFAKGTVLNGRYVIEEVLGQGGMGIVYKVLDPLNPDRALALKTIAAPDIRLPMLNLFRAEFRTMARLRHPHIAAVYDFEPMQGGSGHLFTLEFVDGIDIFEATRGAAWRPIVDLLVQLCRALSYLHSREVIHFDLKPSNVMVDRAGRVVVLDFGVAGSAGLTHARGTPSYLAPERVTAPETVDRRADLYSLGIMAFELLTGGLPFSGTATEVIHRHGAEPVTFDGLATVPDWLQKIVLRLCAKAPRDRFRDANTVIEALNREGGLAYELETHETRDSYVFCSDFVGREAELSIVSGHVEATSRGEAGAPIALLISGPSGMGKSRLLRELKVRGEVSTRLFIEGSCYEDQLLEYGPLSQMLLQLVRTLEGGGGAPLIARLGPELVKLEPRLRERGLVPSAPLQPASAERKRLLDALADFFIGASRLCPISLCLNDLHWATEGTIEALVQLARKISYAKESGDRPPLALIGTTREDEMAGRPIERFLRSLEGALQLVHLRALAANDVERVISSMLGTASIPGPFAARIAEETAGNPLFVEEVMRSLVHNGEVFLEAGRWCAPSAISVLQIPSGVASALKRRLGLLSVEERALMEVLAAHQRPISIELLERVAGASAVHAALPALRQKRLVDWVEGTRLRTTHDRTREIVYEEIAHEKRRELHELIGTTLETSATDDDTLYGLAHHFYLAGDRARALRYSLEGGRKARAEHANGLAITLIQQAVLLAPNGELSETLGTLLESSGRFDEARAQYEGARALTDAPVTHARLHRRIAGAWLAQQRYPEAATSLRLAQEALGQEQVTTGALEERIQVQLETARLHYWRGESPAMQQALGSVAPFIDENATDAQRAHFHISTALLDCRRHRYVVSDEILSHSLRGVEYAERSGNINELLYDVGVLGLNYLWANKLVEAEQVLTRAIAIGRRIGDLTLLSVFTAYQALLHRKTGDLRATKTHLAEALAISTAVKKREYIATSRGTEAWVAWREHRPEESRLKAEQALTLWQEALPSYPFRWVALWPLLAVSFDEGKLEEARAHGAAMLDPVQQRPPEEIERALADAIAAPEESVSAALSRVIELARAAAFL